MHRNFESKLWMEHSKRRSLNTMNGHRDVLHALKLLWPLNELQT